MRISQTPQRAGNPSLSNPLGRNYSAFIAISKEIATLENEMLELKTVLEEFKTIPATLDTKDIARLCRTTRQIRGTVISQDH